MFCTKCGKPVGEDSDFCTHCGNKIDYKINEERPEPESKEEEEITENENLNTLDEEEEEITENENLNTLDEEEEEEEVNDLEEENNKISNNIKNEATTELVKNSQTPLNKQNMKQEIDKLCGGFLGNDSFKIKLLENGLDDSTPNVNYKSILKNETKNGHINSVEELESRLGELMKMDVTALDLYADVKKRGSHNFRKQEELNEFLGFSYAKKWKIKYNKKNPINVQEERKIKAQRIREENELNAKAALEKHENYLKELRETKTAKIAIPYGNGIESSTAMGALTGDLLGYGAGTVIGGAMGAGDMLGTLTGAATGSLILGGAGALIGGLIAASDDGIRWADSILVIKEDVLTISGKFSLNLTDINLVELGTYKNKDVITLTLNNDSIQFATPNGEALKIVLEECIEESKSKIKEKQLSSNPIQNENNISIAEELIKYNELYQQGILTEEEFTALKKKLLGL